MMNIALKNWKDKQVRARLFLWLFLITPSLTSAQLQLNFPVPRIVFQRNNSNQAPVPFSAVLTSSSVTQVNVRLVVRQGGTTTGWTTFTPANGLVSGQVPSVQGGWYDLEAEAFNGSSSLGIKRIQRIGVGEVLLVSGQSNAQGFPYETGAADDRVSCVNYYDGSIAEYRFPVSFSHLSPTVNVGPTNSVYIYGVLGDKLVQRLDVPILFYGAALGATPSVQWRQSAEGLLDIPDADHWDGAEDLRPYRAIKSTLNHYVQRTGLRAILWHQGESDKGLSGSAYVSNLQKVIEVSRQDVGVPTLPWLIAQASWINGGGDNNIVQAQNQVIAQVPHCYSGPNTDLYDNSYRKSDGTHFLTSFYPQLAESWNQSLSSSFFQLSTPYVLPSAPTRITVGQPQPAYQYTGGHLIIPILDEAATSTASPPIYTAQLVSSTGQFVTNLGIGTSQPLRVNLPTNLTAGNYQIRVVSSAGGPPSTLSPPITVFAPGYAQGSGTGLTGQFISGSDPDGPVLHTEVNGPLDLSWFDTPPAPFLPIREYVIRWMGQVEAPVTGNYTILTNNDDGVRVWINGQLLIDDWTNHPWASERRSQITLQANQRYTIRVDLIQGWNNAQSKLEWVVPGTNQAVFIPKDRLYPTTTPVAPDADPIQVIFPGPRTVFQRDNNNTAQMTIKGSCPARSERIEVRVSPTASGYGLDNDFYVVLDNQPANGSFSGQIAVTGGWYRLDVQAIAQGKVICHTRVTPVGVGEVFVIAGDDNAQGVTPLRSVVASADDRVSSVPHYNYTDTTRLPMPPLFSSVAADGAVGPRGSTAWCWSELGELLTNRLSVPVLFYNVAWAGTTIRNWRESLEGTATTVGGNPVPAGMPYSNFKRVLQDYVSLTGLRAVLWQQGETEYYSTDPQATNYANDLRSLITRTRLDAGSSQLPWLVARSSADNTTTQLFPSGSYEPVTNRQNEVIQTTAQVLAGPITDTIQMPRPDGEHFQGTGLSRLAAAWNAALTNAVWSMASKLPQSPTLSDLRLSAQATTRVKSLGSDFQLTLTVWNEGPTAVSNVLVRCFLPTTLQFTGSTSMSHQQGTVQESIPSLAAGEQITVTFTVQPQQPGLYRVAAEIIRADQLDQDSRPNTSVGNGEDDVAWIDFRTVEDSPSIFTVFASQNAPMLPLALNAQPLPDPNMADLSLQIITSTNLAFINVPISVSLLVKNTGGQTAQNVQIGWTLPAGLLLNSNTTNTPNTTMGISSTNGQGTITSIPPNGQAVLTFLATPTTSGTWTVQAQIEAATPQDPDSTPNNGFTNGEDDTASLSLRTP